LLCPESSFSAQAKPGEKTAEGETTINVQQHIIKVSGRLGIGRLDGEAKELVYDTSTGGTLSELTWQLEDVWMLNAGLSITPASWIKINADLWVKLNEGSGAMDDYDWFVSGWDWTDWSHHEDTDLTEGYIIDINAEVPFYSYGGTVFSGIIGFKRDSWEWEVRGGDYAYSINAFRDTSGSFPAGELGITYKQWYDVPYLGVGFFSRLTNMSFSGRFIASPFASANDEDTHHMRDLLFEEDFDTTFMWSIDLAASYYFTPQFALTGMFHYQKYDEAKGSTTITDLVTGEKYYYAGDAAGTDHTSHLLTLFLEYTF